MAKKKSKYYYRYRHAGTGWFVPKGYAEKHPETTIRERVLRKGAN